MKYLIVLADGMADTPTEKLNGKTPMECAKKPIMDMLASKSTIGTVLNVPEGMVPESDTANLAVLSYDPKIYSKGRSPLEAASMGIPMSLDDTAFRCNLVTLSEDEDDYSERHMVDHSSDNISSEDAKILMQAVNDALSSEERRFYPGMSYRESMIIENAPEKVSFSRPHDIIGKKIGEYLPSGEDGEYYSLLMKKSYDILNSHPLNIERAEKGLHKANSIWFWSPGKKAALPDFHEKWELNATMISAVDLLKGIGKLAGMDVPDIEGATGTVDTNYEGKANAAIKAFESGKDFVYIHLEGPDECGHQADAEGKVRAIENIDSRIIAPLYDYLSVCGDKFKIMVLPDHPTPLDLRTHSSDSVPFMIYSSTEAVKGVKTFTEASARKTSIFIPEGDTLLSLMIEKKTNVNKGVSPKDKEAPKAPEKKKTEKKKENKAEAKIGALNKKLSSIADIFEVFILSLVAVVAVMTLLIRHSPVSGPSMLPSLEDSDILIVSNLFYTPSRGDIVIFQVDEPEHNVPLSKPIVKRVIAVGGDEVWVDPANWVIKVNGETVDQSYLGDITGKPNMNKLYPSLMSEHSFKVPEGKVFALGDNRLNSNDSRALGCIDERCIVGKVILRVLPISKFGTPD